MDFLRSEARVEFDFLVSLKDERCLCDCASFGALAGLQNQNQCVSPVGSVSVCSVLVSLVWWLEVSFFAVPHVLKIMF